jgi:hypothetical protein
MRPPRLLGVCLLLLPACAGNTHRFEAGAMFVRPRGDAALQNTAGTLSLPDVQSTLGDLGAEDTEAAPYISGTTIADVHRIRARSFWWESRGNGVLGADFGDLPAGSNVDATIDVVAMNGAYSYEMARSEEFRWGLGAALSYTQMDYVLRTAGNTEDLAVDLFMPMPYVEAEWTFGDLALGANLGLMALEIGDNDGVVADFEAQARYRILPELELLGGYRYLRIDADGDAQGRDYAADLELNGLFVGAVLRF